MMGIQIKRVYEKAEPEDGYRVLVDRLWPRGIRKEDLAMDEWAKQVAPLPETRKAFGHRVERWETFKAAYLLELDANPEAAAFVERLRSLDPARVTLLYAAKDAEHNHALVLAGWLRERLS